MAFHDVFMVTHEYTWGMRTGAGGTVLCSNVFFYRQMSAQLTGAETLRNAFGEYFDLFAAATTDNIQYEGTEFVNLATPTDFYNHIGGTLGDRDEDSQPMPSFIAMQFVTNRNGPGTRAGRKRLAILHESDVIGNTVPEAVRDLAIFEDLVSFYAQTLSLDGWVFAPVVVHHPIALGVNPGVSYTIEGAQISSRVSTQNTRKR